MELFWGWFQENRQVGLAVGMVRRFLHARGDANYVAWSGPAVGALAAGIPQSEGMEFALTPEDFYVWATEVESILFAAYTAEQGAARVPHRGSAGGMAMDNDEAAFMERGRRGGERQRRGDRSRSCRETEARRRRGARACRGSGGTRETPKPKARPGRGGNGLATAPWRRAEPATGSEGPAMVATAVEGAPAGPSGEFAFVPAPPRDNDDSVDVWRYLLGIDREALPNGEETTGQDRPFFPPARADYIRTVVAGYTSTQQGLMTLGLLTALRAMLSELGNILHLASYVEVPLDAPPPAAEEPAGEPDPDDGGESDSTMWLQLLVETVPAEGVVLVQKDVNLVSSLVLRLQDALMGGDAGLSRLRAAHFRGRLRKLRLDANVDGSVADQLEAVCVVAEEAGSGTCAMGYHAMEAQVAEWTWSWWRLVEPVLLLQPEDPPKPADPQEVGSSLEASSTAGPSEAQSLAVLAADQEETRRDDEALARQQELYEAEESLHYRGLEEGVHRELELRASQEAQSWDDWALYDEMNNGRPRGRKRAYLAITVDAAGASGSEGPPHRWKIPFSPRVGRVMTVDLQYEEERDEGLSDASTVRPAALVHQERVAEADGAEGAGPAGQHLSHDSLGDGAFPLEFNAFQALYDEWTRGCIRDEEVRDRYGPAALDMLQAQHIVVSEGTQAVAELPVVANAPEPVSHVVPASGSAGDETFLDTLLSTCRSWRSSQNGSYEDVDQ